MVVLDSDHSAGHVTKEIEAYAPIVAVGCYLVVFDTNLGGNPIENRNAPGPGPMSAVRDYLSNHSDFDIDIECEKFYLTFAPNGWLKKVRASNERGNYSKMSGDAAIQQAMEGGH